MTETIKPYQACQSTEGWVPIPLPSETTPGVVYRVMVCPWQSPSENICECRGYVFQGRCKHQTLAQQKVCGWTELQVKPPDMEPRAVQTEEQRRYKVCPMCGGPTIWKMEVEDEERT